MDHGFFPKIPAEGLAPSELIEFSVFKHIAHKKLSPFLNLSLFLPGRGQIKECKCIHGKFE